MTTTVDVMSCQQLDLRLCKILRIKQLITGHLYPSKLRLSRDNSLFIYSLLVDCYHDEVDHAMLSLLTTVEQRRFMSYLDRNTAYNFLLGRLLMRRGIADVVNTDLSLVTIVQETPMSKPISPFAFFNISHTQNLLVGAFSRVLDCGIDVEDSSLILDFHGIVEYWFPHEFRDAFFKLPLQLRLDYFYRVWSYLEATGKLYGRGLGTFSMSIGDEFNYRLSFAKTPYTGHLAVSSSPICASSVASNQACTR